jgi:hypothetical protein
LRERYSLNGFFTDGGIEFNWINDGQETGIEAVTFSTQNGKIRIDEKLPP